MKIWRKAMAAMAKIWRIEENENEMTINIAKKWRRNGVICKA
jgi:hypothetical protein